MHIPFCRNRCDYCAFATWTDRDHLIESYASACVSEIEAAVSDGMLPLACTVFFGGGTPSRLPGELLASILDSIPVAAGAEITVECNPEDASAELFEAWLSAGVTRVSFGVQSMVPHVLADLGRVHDPLSVARAVGLAGDCGFESFSIDLIFGASAETDGDWEQSLRQALELDPRPPHISAYALTIEPGTPLSRDAGRFPDDDIQAARYEMTDAILSAAGYEWYEISNWSLPGHRCRHNELYWRQGNYLGIGAAAHSHVDGRRWWNLRTPERYIAAIDEKGTTVAGEEVLTPEQQRFESLALSLRTADGVPDACIPADVALDGLVSSVGGCSVLTVKGRLLANAVTSRLNL